MILNSLMVFNKNIERTNSLIVAIEKIKDYNFLYQQKSYTEPPPMSSVIIKVQNEELAKIIESCCDHALISLATAFETYYKELLLDILLNNPQFFLNQPTQYSANLAKLGLPSPSITSKKLETCLNIRYRDSYSDFFRAYNIPWLTDSNDETLIKTIFDERNYLVHNVNRPDTKMAPQRDQEEHPLTKVKRLTKRLTKLVYALDKQINSIVTDAG